ncbi:hypothetical protein [Pedobacter arcticus]|uniref:hypothetical protein n=1 Tax=Pedobacter arcticus TaxID=752140 RepID=UPI0002DAB6EF|nr:hypothetical protein [Pedobacter arcticus]
MKRDYRPIFAICKANGLEYKDKVAEFTNGRTDSLTALSDAEFREFKRQMHQLSPTEFVAKPGDKQRKKMIGLARSMRKENPLQAVDDWCIQYGKFAKPLMQHSVDELNYVLYIYEHKVYKEFLEELNK